jgi:hypothetical protein
MGRGSGGYVRSDHLDNLTWMVLETCVPSARKVGCDESPS